MAYQTISPEQAAGYFTPTLNALKNQGFNPEAVLDIGAAHGHFYHICRRVWPTARYTLVEGTPENKFFLNNLPDTEVYYTFLGARSEVRNAYYDVTSPVGGGTSLYRENTEFFADDRLRVVPVQVEKLDNLLPGRKYDLIKLDTQGSELDILRGGQEKLMDAQVVVMECSFVNYNHGAPLIDDVVKFMQFYGFLMYDVTGPGGHGANWMGRKIQCDVFFVHQSRKDLVTL